ncbi:hypothetical protein [Anatilimnocola floriformis]|uniref:hypothetical protein n=1 Tax=Anatilimnocola floriformis TaxID=2948575 RepID=UPI0020C4B966|nr:hypothetical protein [Anatilimnocola floriformis]
MDQSLACPHCGQIVLNQPALAGQLVQCPGCNGQFQLPMLAVVVPARGASTRNSTKLKTGKRPIWPWVLGFFVLGLVSMGLSELGVFPKGDPEAAARARLEREEQRKQQVIAREKQRLHEQEMADIFAGKRSSVPDIRFGLSEDRRKTFFREWVLIEDSAGIHTSTAEALKDAICREYKITRSQAMEIFVESHEKNWPLPPEKIPAKK